MLGFPSFRGDVTSAALRGDGLLVLGTSDGARPAVLLNASTGEHLRTLAHGHRSGVRRARMRATGGCASPPRLCCCEPRRPER